MIGYEEEGGSTLLDWRNAAVITVIAHNIFTNTHNIYSQKDIIYVQKNTRPSKMEVYHRGLWEHKWLQMATWNDLNKWL